MRLAGTYSNLSDSELDDTYASVWALYEPANAKDKVVLAQTLASLETEILDRLRGFSGFASGFFGYTRFPKYDALAKAGKTLSGFQQTTVAQQAVAQSAQNVASKLTWGVGTIAVVGIAVVMGYAYLRGGRK